MFDFVISGNQQRRPAKRLFASWMTSCLAHAIALLMLIEYPELLRGGVYQRFREMWQPPPANDDNRNWRPVAVLPTRMTMPSAETLRKLLSDSKGKESPVKPVRIRLNDIQALLSNQAEKPIVRPAGGNSSSPPDNGSASAPPIFIKPETGSPGSPAGNPNAGDSGKQGIAKPPLPVSEPNPVVATVDVVPKKIPNVIPAPPEPPPVLPNNLNAPGRGERPNRNTAIIIDSSKGFPMGDYTSRIEELLKEKWFIPSYLKDSQGHTTVHFYIDKNGHTIDVRILTGSGSDPLDRAALSAVLSCNNLPALPKGYPGEQVGVRFVFSYNEHQ
jgi:TonB family protein